MSHKIFLLGGKDLEMLYIAKMLSQCHIRFYDNNLQWDNALLSAYQDVLTTYSGNSEYEIYGIELREDCELPPNYIGIDHHNEQNNKASSLEQVALLLNVELDYHQQLIAANDKSYIDGMKALGATQAEIEEIRLADRKAQGITDDEERQAKFALDHHMQKIANLILVQSNTSAFSPICDALYPCEHLLIFTEKEWVYYGKAKGELMEYFKDDISAGHVFYGGSACGYIGLARGSYNFSYIETMIEQIKSIINHE